MARFVDPGRSRENIDRVVELWKEHCLLDDGSLLFEDHQVWSLAHLQDFRERFLTGAIYGTGENFEEKLRKQLEDASAEVRLLAAELLIVHFLFAYVAIGPEAKIKIIQSGVNLLNARADASSDLFLGSSPHERRHCFDHRN